jgi:hypothetical protein
MPPSNVEVSKDGLKLPYRRFLADSAVGYILLLTLLIAYRMGTLNPLLGDALEPGLQKEEKVFALVLLVLLTVPVGLALNALSWFALGPSQRRLQGFFYRHSRWLKTIRREYKVDAAEKYFGLSTEDPDAWYDRAQSLKQVLYSHHPEQTHELEHVRGIRTFLRNVSLLAFFFALASPFLATWTATAVWIGVALLASAVSALTGMNYNCQIYERALFLSYTMGYTGKEDLPDPVDWQFVHLLATLQPVEATRPAKIALGPEMPIVAPAPGK